MTKPATRIAIILLLAAAVVSGFLLLSQVHDATPPIPSGAAENSEIRSEPSRPTAGILAPAEPQPLRPQAAHSGPVTTPASEIEEEAGPPVWQPRYTAALERGGGRAEFELVDAKDQRLDSTKVNVALQRLLGPYARSDGASYDGERGVIVCDGLSGAGLEPGDYELEIRAGPYGAFRHHFTLSRGQYLAGRLRTPNWRRTITLMIVDQGGVPVSHLTVPPWYGAEEMELESVQRAWCRPVLRDPPTQSGGNFGLGGGSGGALNELAPPAGVCYATDEGRWYISVYAGARGSLSFVAAGDLFEGETSHGWHCNFTEHEWDLHTVEVHPHPDYAERLKALTVCNKDDPGGRRAAEPKPWKPVARQSSLEDSRLDMWGAKPAHWTSVQWPPNPQQAAPSHGFPYDLDTLPDNHVRLIVRNASGCPGVMQARANYAVPEPGEPCYSKDGSYLTNMAAYQVLKVETAEGVWWCDVPREKSVWGLHYSSVTYWFTDHALFTSPPRSMVIPSEGRLIEDVLAVDHRNVRLRITPTHTLAAWCVDMSVTLSGVPAVRSPWFPRMFLSSGSCLECETAMERRWWDRAQAWPVKRGALEIESAICANAIACPGVAIEIRLLGPALFPRGWRPDGVSAVAGPDDGIALDLERGVVDVHGDRLHMNSPLLLRAVGDMHEGLPWAEGSIIDYEHDALATRILALERWAREHEKALKVTWTDPKCIMGASKAPAPESLDKPKAVSDYAHVSSDTPREVVDALMGKLCADTFAAALQAYHETADARRNAASSGGRDERAYFCKYGAWYNTRRKIESDTHGYVVIDEAGLTPSKRYVLYLWSNSRDDLEPDLRVDFVAGVDGTDLGVIALPSYRE